jgi:hypothetical protein
VPLPWSNSVQLPPDAPARSFASLPGVGRAGGPAEAGCAGPAGRSAGVQRPEGRMARRRSPCRCQNGFPYSPALRRSCISGVEAPLGAPLGIPRGDDVAAVADDRGTGRGQGRMPATAPHAKPAVELATDAQQPLWWQTLKGAANRGEDLSTPDVWRIAAAALGSTERTRAPCLCQGTRGTPAPCGEHCGRRSTRNSTESSALTAAQSRKPPAGWLRRGPFWMTGRAPAPLVVPRWRRRGTTWACPSSYRRAAAATTCWLRRLSRRSLGCFGGGGGPRFVCEINAPGSMSEHAVTTASPELRATRACPSALERHKPQRKRSEARLEVFAFLSTFCSASTSARASIASTSLPTAAFAVSLNSITAAASRLSRSGQARTLPSESMSNFRERTLTSSPSKGSAKGWGSVGGKGGEPLKL